MDTVLSNLTSLLAPPFRDAHRTPSTIVLNGRHFTIPNDYREYCEVYGSGVICDADVNKIRNYSVYDNNDMKLVVRDIDILIEVMTGHCSNILVEELLPIGRDDGGGSIYYFMRPGSEWSIVTRQPRSHNLTEYHTSFVDFMYRVISRQIVCDLWSDDFHFRSSKKVQFVPKPGVPEST